MKTGLIVAPARRKARQAQAARAKPCREDEIIAETLRS